MTRYVWDASRRDWVERAPRPPAPRIHLIGDFAAPVFSHADGRTYTGRRAWRDHLKRHGLVEYGNDRIARPAFEPRSAMDDIARAVAGMPDDGEAT